MKPKDILKMMEVFALIFSIYAFNGTNYSDFSWYSCVSIILFVTVILFFILKLFYFEKSNLFFSLIYIFLLYLAGINFGRMNMSMLYFFMFSLFLFGYFAVSFIKTRKYPGRVMLLLFLSVFSALCFFGIFKFGKLLSFSFSISLLIVSAVNFVHFAREGKS